MITAKTDTEIGIALFRMFSCDEMTVGFPNPDELVEKDEFVKMSVVKLSLVLENDSLLGRSSEIKFSVELGPAGLSNSLVSVVI